MTDFKWNLRKKTSFKEFPGEKTSEIPITDLQKKNGITEHWINDKNDSYVLKKGRWHYCYSLRHKTYE